MHAPPCRSFYLDAEGESVNLGDGGLNSGGQDNPCRFVSELFLCRKVEIDARWNSV